MRSITGICKLPPKNYHGALLDGSKRKRLKKGLETGSCHDSLAALQTTWAKPSQAFAIAVLLQSHNCNFPKDLCWGNTGSMNRKTSLVSWGSKDHSPEHERRRTMRCFLLCIEHLRFKDSQAELLFQDFITTELYEDLASCILRCAFIRPLILKGRKKLKTCERACMCVCQKQTFRGQNRILPKMRHLRSSFPRTHNPPQWQ